jgi:hypothetical protein
LVRVLILDDEELTIRQRLSSELGHGSLRRTGPQAGGDRDVDEAASAVGCERAAQSFVARDRRDEVV